MSQTFLSAFVILAVQGLSYLGFEVGSEQLTTTWNTLLTIGSALWILYRRYLVGDVNKIGRRI